VEYLSGKRWDAVKPKAVLPEHSFLDEGRLKSVHSNQPAGMEAAT